MVSLILKPSFLHKNIKNNSVAVIIRMPQILINATNSEIGPKMKLKEINPSPFRSSTAKKIVVLGPKSYSIKLIRRQRHATVIQ
ncbi:hypothetical protein HN51_044463 [Arachis hypogaea]